MRHAPPYAIGPFFTSARKISRSTRINIGHALFQPSKDGEILWKVWQVASVKQKISPKLIQKRGKKATTLAADAAGELYVINSNLWSSFGQLILIRPRHRNQFPIYQNVQLARRIFGDFCSFLSDLVHRARFVTGDVSLTSHVGIIIFSPDIISHSRKTEAEEFEISGLEKLWALDHEMVHRRWQSWERSELRENWS